MNYRERAGLGPCQVPECTSDGNCVLTCKVCGYAIWDAAKEPSGLCVEHQRPEPVPCATCGQAPDGGDANYPGQCAVCAWKAWLLTSDPDGFWNKVECIECELGRDCVKHLEANP